MYPLETFDTEMYELDWREDINFEEFEKLLFFDKGRLDYIPFTTRLEGEIERPIEANLFKELDNDDVEKTDFINPVIFPFFDFDEPVVSYFLFIPSKSSSILLSISLRKVFIDTFRAESFTSFCSYF